MGAASRIRRTPSVGRFLLIRHRLLGRTGGRGRLYRAYLVAYVGFPANDVGDQRSAPLMITGLQFTHHRAGAADFEPIARLGRPAQRKIKDHETQVRVDGRHTAEGSVQWLYFGSRRRGQLSLTTEQNTAAEPQQCYSQIADEGA